MSESYFLESKAAGTWEYEIQEGKVKVNYPVNFGFNEIPEDHRKTLEDDPGYQARIKKGEYKEIKAKGKRAVEDKIERENNKTLDTANDLKKAKDAYKEKITEMKSDCEKKLKDQKDAFNTKYQTMVDLRGEALKEAGDFKDGKVKILGEHAGILAGLKEELKIQTNTNTELRTDLGKCTSTFESEKSVIERELEKLKTSGKKDVDNLKVSHKKENDGLKSEIASLKKQIEKLKEVK